MFHSINDQTADQQNDDRYSLLNVTANRYLSYAYYSLLKYLPLQYKVGQRTRCIKRNDITAERLPRE